jgi:hypothetical protein
MTPTTYGGMTEEQLRELLAKAPPLPWRTDIGCCGPYIDYQAHEDERGGIEPISNYDGREPVWLGGDVDDVSRILMCETVNALPDLLSHIAELKAERDELQCRVEALELIAPKPISIDELHAKNLRTPGGMTSEEYVRSLRAIDGKDTHADA